MSKQIRAKFQDVMDEAKVILEDFPWEDQMAYALWLKQTYYFVSYSTRIVSMAGARFPLSKNSLHERFLAHCSEEKGHEKLLISDIKALGLDEKSLTVFSSTKAFYQNQHYWIDHVNPIAFFGYLLLLEGLAATHGSWITARLKAHYGAKPVTFFKVHSDEDEDHLEKAFSFVNQTTPDEEGAIIENLEISAMHYFKFLSDIKDAVRTPNKDNKAA